MHDVARAAGVSQAAVSYAFSRPDRLSNARREHILKILDITGLVKVLKVYDSIEAATSAEGKEPAG